MGVYPSLFVSMTAHPVIPSAHPLKGGSLLPRRCNLLLGITCLDVTLLVSFSNTHFVFQQQIFYFNLLFILLCTYVCRGCACNYTKAVPVFFYIPHVFVCMFVSREAQELCGPLTPSLTCLHCIYLHVTVVTCLTDRKLNTLYLLSHNIVIEHNFLKCS